MQNPRPSRRLALCALALTFLLASCSQGGTTSSQTTQAHGKGSSSTASAARPLKKTPILHSDNACGHRATMSQIQASLPIK